jgi:hypothetical protein
VFNAAIAQAYSLNYPALDGPKYPKVDVDSVIEYWHRLHADYIAGVSEEFATSIRMVK